jgi:type I restriction enzyme S subunit
MELMSGRKQTDVGFIPIDWEVKKLSDISNVVRGASPRPAGDPRYFKGDFIPWLTVAALTNIPDTEMFVTETVDNLTEEGSLYSRKLERGTLIIANSGATLGVAKVLAITCCANDGIAALLNLNAGEKRFICHYLNSRTQYLREVVAAGNGQPNLNTDRIGGILIPFPPLKEQRAIATALSDVDTLINSLDKLIAKKRNVKQAAMQQLLTGKTRLPGFSGKWETDYLGGVIEKITGGGTPSRSQPEYWNGDIFWATVKDVSNFDPTLTQESITNLGLSSSSSNLIRQGTLITSTRMALGKAVIYDVDVAINQDLKAIYPNHKADSKFLYFWFQYYSTLIANIGNGSTVKGITVEDLRSLPFSLIPVPEQQAIAAVFSDMDAEITALVQKRDKTRALKQGMMQELLTGRVRLA